MNPDERQRLEAAGWTIGDASDFLGLSPEEAAFIELKLALSKRLKQQRESQQLTQQALAKRIKSSQSRVAKMEAGDPSVSLDLLIRTLLSAGATAQDIAEVIQNTAVQPSSHGKELSKRF
jgi:DNA-binding XRE family transcriptional regulator